MLTVQPRPTRSPSTQAESALPQDPTKLVSQRINIPATVMQKGRVLSRPSPTHIRATPLASLPTGSRLGDRHDSPPADTKNQPFPSLHMRPALRPALVPCLLHFIQCNEDARCIRQAVASHYGTFNPHLLHGLILPVTHTHSALHCTLTHMPTVSTLLPSFPSFPSPLAFCVHCQRR